MWFDGLIASIPALPVRPPPPTSTCGLARWPTAGKRSAPHSTPDSVVHACIYPKVLHPARPPRGAEGRGGALGWGGAGG
eukprot:gene9052-biopygen10705